MGEQNKKGKISLSGLTKGGNNFPSFRFSPENEEIEEIMLEDPTADTDEKAQSLPDSPKATTGDVSPLKEILKHKWSTRSLSLDLDLKGKIITAIEDKKKSIRSHFISEEGEVMPQSNSIAEHIGKTGDVLEEDDKLTSDTKDSGGDIDEAEEIGADYVAHIGYQEQLINNALKFQIPCEMLEEYHHGHVVNQQVDAKYLDSVGVTVRRHDLRPRTVIAKMGTALYEHENVKFLMGLLACAIGFSFVGYSWLAGILWMLIGGMVVNTWQQSLCGNDLSESKEARQDSVIQPVANTKANDAINLSTTSSPNIDIDRTFASQGWMTEVEAEYEPLSCHMSSTRVIFARLRGSHLYISYPHPKNRILKRRMWNDPPLTGQLTFTRHCIFTLKGANVYLAPEKLSKRRIWSKKYPIAIKLSDTSVVTVVTPGNSHDGDKNSNPSTPAPTPNGSIGVEAMCEDEGSIVSKEESANKTLYLFTRTDREKDYWFRDLVSAAKARPDSPAAQTSEDLATDYIRYMSTILPLVHLADSSADTSQTQSSATNKKDKMSAASNAEKISNGKKDSDSDRTDLENGQDGSRRSSPSLEESLGMENIVTIPQSPEFLNAFLWRIFFDFFRNESWTSLVSELTQKKLNYIRKPQFLDTLMVRDLDLGSALPIIQRASAPVMDDRGLWIDLDISYDGNIVVTLETKLNLLKLRKSPSQDQDDGSPSHGPSGFYASDDNTSSASPVTVANMFDSDAYDSGESSEDDISTEEWLSQHPNGENGAKDDEVPTSEGSMMGSKSKKILKMAEKIASSKYVQQATEIKVVKKAIANVSNTPLVLSVEIKSIVGTLVLNIPPPPTDRLWIGFRYNPAMQISAKPKFGSRTVSLTHVVDWIEKKLLHEFQRVMVFPNMNDITIPLLDYKLPN